MIESFGPIGSLFRLIVDGLKGASRLGKLSKKRNVARKIVEIQLYLEDIIERAEKILSVIDRNVGKKKLPKKEGRLLQELLHSQLHKIEALQLSLHDDTADQIMKLFLPKIRRQIGGLIHAKGGAINDLIDFFPHFDETQGAYEDFGAPDWNHSIFMREGLAHISYRGRPASKKTKVSLFDRMDERKARVAELVNCSEELSDFIRSNIPIEEAVLHMKDN